MKISFCSVGIVQNGNLPGHQFGNAMRIVLIWYFMDIDDTVFISYLCKIISY